MIVCDADNIADRPDRPTQEVIRAEWQVQMESLKDLRRRLRVVNGAKAIARLLITA